jgi:hypothetical protein
MVGADGPLTVPASRSSYGCGTCRSIVQQLVPQLPRRVVERVGIR